MILDLPAAMPRHAFSTRDRARAGHVWRVFQELAVQGSAACGWPPHRYRAAGSAFVVRRMTVVHHREVLYGESWLFLKFLHEGQGGKYRDKTLRFMGATLKGYIGYRGERGDARGRRGARRRRRDPRPRCAAARGLRSHR